MRDGESRKRVLRKLCVRHVTNTYCREKKSEVRSIVQWPSAQTVLLFSVLPYKADRPRFAENTPC
jgi:hypothetical protein